MLARYASHDHFDDQKKEKYKNKFSDLTKNDHIQGRLEYENRAEPAKQKALKMKQYGKFVSMEYLPKIDHNLAS